jgi:hypothetical protein
MIGQTNSSRVLEHQIHVENEENKNTWTSCCVEVDRRAVVYFSQLAVLSGMMCFCIYQLVELPRCEDQAAYLGLLTLCIGILAPSPIFSDPQITAR